jgi:NitT/TauT family transport system ATP-binding protein
MALVVIREVDFAFGGDRLVFNKLSLELGGESPVLILGPSGCGKTTLLRLIAGLLKPDAGEITIRGNTQEVEVSMVFQEPRLLPWKTVLENVSLPLAERMGKQAAREQARRFLRLVSLEDRTAARPGELSGGQQQRVNLARAFAFPADVLLMDEPFQSLDIPRRIALMDLTLSLLGEFPRLAVMVTHDPREAVYLGKRILVLGDNQRGLIHDETLDLEHGERGYGSAAQGKLEQRLIGLLK